MYVHNRLSVLLGYALLSPYLCWCCFRFGWRFVRFVHIGAPTRKQWGIGPRTPAQIEWMALLRGGSVAVDRLCDAGHRPFSRRRPR